MWRSGGLASGIPCNSALRRIHDGLRSSRRTGPRTGGTSRMVLYAPEFGPEAEPEVEVPAIWYTPPEKLIASVSS
jgi:hypothetical protein